MHPNLTFRVSEVESFRQWRDNEDADLDQLIARMRGELPASEAMLAGTAFHKALEQAAEKPHEALHSMGYTFQIEGDFELAIPPIREVRASKTYSSGGILVTVSGQLDTIYGKRIEDHKTTGRFDPERYLTGYQWRLYLDIFHANHFRWNVFEIEATDDPKTWRVFEAHRLEQYRYPGMERDCAQLVADLGRFALTHLPERLKPMALAA